MYASLILTLASAVQPGRWEVRSTVVEMAVPGVPKFLQRMARGKSKSEEKRLAAGEGVEALLSPDPKAKCRVDSQRVAEGHYAQALTCPQKQREPLHIVRVGEYNEAGFSGRATVAGVTPKGSISIVLDQRAIRTGG